MGIMDSMMEFMLGRMSKEEKEAMMDNMMGKFFADMTAEDKQKLMAEMMPKMMEGVDMMEMMPQMMMSMMGGGEGGGGMMGMMSEMMGGGEGEGGRMDMMSIMIPQCLRMMLPDMPQEKRIDFVLEMVTTLMEQGSGGMSEAEKDDFVAQVVEKVKA